MKIMFHYLRLYFIQKSYKINIKGFLNDVVLEINDL